MAYAVFTEATRGRENHSDTCCNAKADVGTAAVGVGAPATGRQRRGLSAGRRGKPSSRDAIMKIKAVPGQYFLTLQTGSNSCEEDEKQKAARVTNEKRRDKFEKTNTNVLYFWNKRRTTGKSAKAPSVWEEPSRLGLSPARAGLTWVLLVSGPGTSAPVRASGLLVTGV